MLTNLTKITNFTILTEKLSNIETIKIALSFRINYQFSISNQSKKADFVVNFGSNNLNEYENSIFYDKSFFNHIQKNIKEKMDFPISIVYEKTKITTNSNSNSNSNSNIKPIINFLNHLNPNALSNLTILIQKYTKKNQVFEYYNYKNHTFYVSEINYPLIINQKNILYQQLNHDLPITKPQTNETNLEIDYFNDTKYLGSKSIFQHQYRDFNKNQIKELLIPILKSKLKTLKLIPFKNETKLDQFQQPLKTNYVLKYNRILYLKADLPYLKFFLKQTSIGFKVKSNRLNIKRKSFYFKNRRFYFNLSTLKYQNQNFEYLIDLKGKNRYSLGIINLNQKNEFKYLTINIETNLSINKINLIQDLYSKLSIKFDLKLFNQIWNLIEKEL
ncbi:conserved hypothetical protein [Candidatus Phytoplasma mali]|uniref:Uncharacterized protein n=1 Tax=Phytoplasma mali (strain AT) TaxID=482235 RepID=B3QZK1_PHYMT|nr:hypothetical protein [Candidatus Phytoplasma mali]CAP18608.1 conserved hypothetical protein [Candidatus Phytoplasma mali]